MPRYKGFLFDFDDTIFDHRYCSRCALNWLLDHHSCMYGTSLDELEQEHRKILEEIHLRKVLTGEMPLVEARAERFRRILERHGHPEPEKVMYETASSYRQVYESSYRLVPGASELLETIKGKAKIVIVTNNLIKEQQGKVKACGIGHLIDELVTSEEVGFTKPEPQIFEEAMKRIKCSPGEVLMIGDSWERDVVGAANFGIKNIWINIYDEPCPDKDLVLEFSSVIELNKCGLIKSLL